MHDSRHTIITELSEGGAGDRTIMDIAGHVSSQMLKHYSHIRMQAKRDALQVIGENQKRAEDTVNNAKPAQDCSPEPTDAQEVERESLQKSLQSLEGIGEAPSTTQWGRLSRHFGLETSVLRLCGEYAKGEEPRGVFDRYAFSC